LLNEGVPFVSEYVVDLERCLWEFDDPDRLHLDDDAVPPISR
jgi:hypothetical protein